MEKKLPIGIEDFREMVKEEFYYIDKTGFIRELLNHWGKVNLFTRPRRFGKTLIMTMLKAFFEIGQEKYLFHGLEISNEIELCEKYQGKYPVIFITLKGVNGTSFQEAYHMLVNLINKEARRFQFLLDSDRLTTFDKEMLIALLKSDMKAEVLKNSLLVLSELLQKYYNQKVIILIDEYDVPLDKSFDCGYYNEMVSIVRELFGQALKTNESLYFAVLTGCLRISKESIFTGLNNFKVLSITDLLYDEYFGFTDKEVVPMLKTYHCEEYYKIAKQWYNGYRFGNVEVYCPWDVLNYCDALRTTKGAEPQPYWIHTSSNSIIKRFLQKANKQTKREIERLIAGETIKKTVKQELTYSELESSIENLWSILFSTGYLTQRGGTVGTQLELAIPNLEIQKIFIEQIQEWFQENMRRDTSKLDSFCDAFAKGDAKAVEELFRTYLVKTIRIRDTNVRKARKENFYHGILLGLLSYREDWTIDSNIESGEGYSDIQIEIGEGEKGIIIELKYSDNGDLEAGCAEALKQIDKMDYAARFREEGVSTILKYGIACYKKHCKVVLL